jgi:hypothetical protein
MRLQSPYEIDSPLRVPAPPLLPGLDDAAARPHSESEVGPDDQQDRVSRRPRWPLVAIAFAAVITLIWNILLVWALIGVLFS